MRVTAFSGVLVGAAMVAGAIGYPLLAERALITETVYITKSVTNAVVYIDEHGSPIYTSTIATLDPGIESTAVVPSVVVASSTAAVIEPALPGPVLPTPAFSLDVQPTSASLSHAAERPAEHTTAPASSQATSVAVVPSSSQAAFNSQPSSAPEQGKSSDSFPLGITYDTFKGSQGSIECKTPDEMAAEFEKMKEFGIVRIYGNDCGVIPVAVQQARKNNQKLMAGIYTPNQDIQDVVSALSDAVSRYNGGDWSIISLVSVENERVNARVVTVAKVHDIFDQVRNALSKVGYYGPIGPVETVPAIVNSPDLCDKSDMTLVNIHAFFDPNTKAEDAGTFVKSEVQRVKNACPNKRVVVTESGWPSQGTSHDKAEVSKSAQAAAIKSIRASFDHDLFLFNAFDSTWKSDDDSTFNAERWWGIL
ncbi:unnamed protein product [Periconia digitata]|uniref:Glycoside hydrolase n=1 Tax=Periconia digitata TaxID=1303443 RepID=A0A9W4UPN3_9PLEO|nr:unnamed protein product [Periconia digitata]